MSEVRYFNTVTKEWQEKQDANTLKIEPTENDMELFGPIEKGEEGEKREEGKEIEAGEDR